MARRTERRTAEVRLADLGVGVYGGAGASHSWTWLVDCLERLGFSRVAVFDESAVRTGALDSVDAFAVGGGDPVAMALGMGAEGAAAIGQFVDEGGLYVGFCAGAYLIMRIEYEPLEPFTFTDVTADNIVHHLPPIRALPQKAATAYGGRYALHPVRERVRFAVCDTDLGGSEELVDAPLYGGPPMVLSSNEVELARFDSFCPDTLFLVDETLASRMLVGGSAGFTRRRGSGTLCAFAPHLEHPGFPRANAMLGRLIERESPRGSGTRESAVEPAPHLLDGAFRALVGEARIVAFSLESSSAIWLLGHKYYDPGKIPEFLDAVWRRLPHGARGSDIVGLYRPGEVTRLEESAACVGALLRRLKGCLADPIEGRDVASVLFPELSSMAALFLNGYFRGVQADLSRGRSLREAG